jgi:hypothetical protein
MFCYTCFRKQLKKQLLPESQNLTINVILSAFISFAGPRSMLVWDDDAPDVCELLLRVHSRLRYARRRSFVFPGRLKRAQFLLSQPKINLANLRVECNFWHLGRGAECTFNATGCAAALVGWLPLGFAGVVIPLALFLPL